MSTETSSSRTSGRWWLAVDGRPDGPRTTAYITAALQAGRLTSLTPVCPEGGCEWRPLATWPALAVTQTPTPSAPLPPKISASDSVISGFGAERLLTNVALPPMANLVCIYSIAAVPIYWLFGFATMFANDNPFVDGTGLSLAYLVFMLLHAAVTLAIAIVLVIGGLRLRDLRASGERIIRLALCLALVWVAVQWVVFLGLLILGASSDALNPETDSSVLGVLEIFVATAAFACDIISLIWLARNRSRLPLNLHA